MNILGGHTMKILKLKDSKNLKASSTEVPLEFFMLPMKSITRKPLLKSAVLLLTCITPAQLIFAAADTTLGNQDLAHQFSDVVPMMPEQPQTGRRTQAVSSLNLEVLRPEEQNRIERVCRKIDETLNSFSTVKGKDIVVFLGRTGTGKSTSINYLDPRIHIAASGSNIILDEAYPNQENALIIGTDLNDSETMYPAYHEMEDGSFFVDLPGFDDSRGPEQNLINAAFIKKIISSANSVKFVFVIPATQMGRDGTGAETLKSISSFYEDALVEQMIRNHSVLLVTKSNKHTESEQHVQKKLAKDSLFIWHAFNKVCYIPQPDDNSGLIDVSRREKNFRNDWKV